MLKIKLTVALLLLFSLQICSAINIYKYDRENLFNGYLTRDQTTCDPDQDCAESGQQGSHVPDPSDCNNFYVCVSVNGSIVASDSPVSCPSGQYFNVITLACEDELQSCTNPCDGRCSMQCSAELDVIPYLGVCTLYQVCLIGGGFDTETCPPETPYFDGETCTDDASRCCDFCTFSCTQIGIQIPDPCDCQMYYICDKLGIPSESTHASCLVGEHFDIGSGTCVIGTTCTPRCLFGVCGTTKV